MQKGMMKAVLEKSWDDWKKNIVKLLVPNVMKSFALVVVLLGLVISESILLVVGYNIRSLEGLNLIIRNSSFLVVVALLLFVDYIIVRGVAAVFRSMNVGLFHDAVTGKKVDLQKMGMYIRKYWKVLFITEVLVAVGVFVPTFVLGMVSLVVSRLGGTGVFIFLLLCTIIYFIGSMVFALYALFFVEPLLGQEYDGNALRLVRKSLRFSNENKNRVILTALLIVGLSLGMGIGLLLLGIAVSLPFSLVGISIGFQLFGRTVSFAAQQVMGVYQRLLVFNAYHAKR